MSHDTTVGDAGGSRSRPRIPGRCRACRALAASRRAAPALTQAPRPPIVVVVGDLVLDVVLAPDRDLERGTDVRGRVLMRQGGSASNAARWLGRLGMRPALVCAVGRHATGRALVADVAGDGVDVKAAPVAGAPP